MASPILKPDTTPLFDCVAGVQRTTSDSDCADSDDAQNVRRRCALAGAHFFFFFFLLCFLFFFLFFFEGRSAFGGEELG